MSSVESSASPTIAIRHDDIHKSFGPVHANRGASIQVARGEIHALDRRERPPANRR
jgi:ABC-type sugar transport system ATPase subunit